MLAGADFEGARLEGASLSGASLERCRLIAAKLRRATLADARARRADFSSASLASAILTGADLRGAAFTHCDLSDFAVVPVIAFALQVYYLFYYRVARRLWRLHQAVYSRTGANASQVELSRYPWIGILVLQSGLASRIGHLPFFTSSWLTTPFLLWVAWIKTAPFHSTFALWIRDGAPASTAFAGAFFLTATLFCGWASYEMVLDRGVLETRRLLVGAAALFATLVGAGVAVGNYASQHRLQLVNAEISRRPANAQQDPRGAILPGVQLAGSKARRAYLAFTNLNEANLRDANLFGATFTEAYLIDAVLVGANLHEADAEGIDASGARLEGAFLGRSHLSGARFLCADLRDAKLKGADLTGANLGGAKLPGALLEDAILRGADLRHTDLGGAFTANAQFDGAVYDDATRFPDGVVPAGARRSSGPQPRYLCP